MAVTRNIKDLLKSIDTKDTSSEVQSIYDPETETIEDPFERTARLEKEKEAKRIADNPTDKDIFNQGLTKRGMRDEDGNIVLKPSGNLTKDRQLAELYSKHYGEEDAARNKAHGITSSPNQDFVKTIQGFKGNVGKVKISDELRKLYKGIEGSDKELAAAVKGKYTGGIGKEEDLMAFYGGEGTDYVHGSTDEAKYGKEYVERKKRASRK
jgi:hypothetical protein